jgi:hypothetical protein
MLSEEEKMKCVELFKWATDESTNPKDWNERAANLLAEMYAEMLTCSSLMDLIPRPPSSKPGWGWLLRYTYDVISRKLMGNRGKIYETCRVIRNAQYKRLISIDLVTG